MTASRLFSLKLPKDYRHLKIKLRTWFRIGSFALLAFGFMLYNAYQVIAPSIELFANTDHRQLAGTSDGNKIFFGPESTCPESIQPKGMVVVLILFVLWLFVGLAIVADDFFVPALDLIAEIYEIPPDVAGATLMAAGGSSPELFASGMGTFLRSSVGFGAIVGSAVFNVLFVVGVCSILSKSIQLTWYPMIRDSLYYCIVLIVLAIFVSVLTPQYIVWWEALILHLMYYLYVYIMSKNTQIHNTIKRYFGSAEVVPEEVAKKYMQDTSPNLLRVSTLKFLTSQKPILDIASTHIVMRLNANIDELFEKYSKRNDKTVDFEEFYKLITDLKCEISVDQAREIFRQLDVDQSQVVDIHEFTLWFTTSTQRIDGEVKSCFDAIDVDKSGFLSYDEIIELLSALNNKHVDKDEIDRVIGGLYDVENCDITNLKVDYERFKHWYVKSPFYAQKIENIKEEEEEMEGISLFPPKDATLYTLFWYLVTIPQVFCFHFTIPDVRKPGNAKYVYVSFVSCLLWFGIYSFFMVKAVQVIGATIGIPSFLMGLTFLAAGTSVPDMLSAVIVAKNGEGDKAVSSSIGSNVFDICVGLALPWLLFWMAFQEHVYINADGVGIAIGVLVACLAAMIGTVWWFNWHITRNIGIFFVFLYFAFVAQQCAIANWGEC